MSQKPSRRASSPTIRLPELFQGQDESFMTSASRQPNLKLVHPSMRDRAKSSGGKSDYSGGFDRDSRTYIDTPTSANPLLALGTVNNTQPWTPERKHWLIMASLSFISFMVSLDATILVTVLPEIAASLHGSAAEAFWTGTSYLLTSAVFQPLIASASQYLGRQQLLITSITLFTFGTTLCALAHDFTVMLIGRCVQGVGGGGIIAITQVIFCDIVPLRERPKYFSVVLGSWSVGSIIGPVVGGALVERASWRWCFLINFPFCVIGLAVAHLFVCLDDSNSSTLSLLDKLRQIDWMGAFLFVNGLTILLVGLSWGGVQHPWASAATIAPIIVGAIGVAAFLAWQLYKGEEGLLPTTLFYNASSAAAFYCALVNGLILYTALYYVPFYQMAVRGSSPVRAGIDLFPAVCFLAPGSVMVAVLTSRLGRFRWAVWLGWCITTLACGLFLMFDLRTETAVFAAILAVFGIGNGMVLTGVNVATQAIAKAKDRAMAACMYAFMRSLGMPLGVALSGTIFQNAMSRALSASGLPMEIARDAERYIAVLQTMETGPRKLAILASYTRGYYAVFVAMTAMSASALVASLFIRKHSMDAVDTPVG